MNYFQIRLFIEDTFRIIRGLKIIKEHLNYKLRFRYKLR